MQTSATQTIRVTPDSRLAAIRETRPEDYVSIAALHRRNGLTIRPFQQWLALWSGNPAYEARGDGNWPLGWVLETERGEIVGSIGNLPLDYEFRGRKLSAATAYGWVVDEAYRSYSVMVLNRFMRQPGIDLFVFTTVGDKAEPIYSSGFQLSRAPVGCWDRSIFWITNYRGFAKSALNHRKVSFGGALCYPAAAGIYAWDQLQARVPSSDPAYEIQLCRQFDDRFEEYWQEIRRKQRHLLPVRSRETLEWHFQHAFSPTTILAILKESRFVGYAIFGRQDNTALGLKRVRIVDFQALEGHAPGFVSALTWMIARCRAEGIHVLEMMGDWLVRPDLPKIAAPHQRTLSSWMYYYKAPDPQLAEALRDPGAWAPSSFDGDASL